MSLVLVLGLYLQIIVWHWGDRVPDRSLNKSLSNWVLVVGLEWYFLFLAVNMMGANPETHLSTGLHQEMGDCNIRAPDITEHTRQDYLCVSTHTQDWTLNCDLLCASNMFEDCEIQTYTWYSVCGKPHTNYGLWAGVTILLCSLGSFIYAWTLKQT